MSELKTNTEQLLALHSQLLIKDGIHTTLNKRPRVPPAQASNFLPLTATLYEPLWRKRSLSILTSRTFSVDRELKLMLEWVAPEPKQVMLDAACSAGLYARTLLEQESSLELYALDFSLPFLKKAQQYAKRDKTPMTFIQADVAALPFKDESFDAIVCGGSLNEFTDLPTTVSEFSRVLKPNGKMWQMYLKPSEGLLGKAIQASLRPSGIRFVKPDVFEALCSEAGMRLVKAQHRNPVVMALFQKTF